MKRVRCPKCDTYIAFDETQYADGQRLVFQCPDCNKQFSIRLGVAKPKEENVPCGSIIVVENCFHVKQTIALRMGDNVIGRGVKGTEINTPIETVDPSVDTKHCIIHVKRNKQGQLQYLLRDAPSNTGTFLGTYLLRDADRAPLTDGSIVTIGATTLILRTTEEEET